MSCVSDVFCFDLVFCVFLVRTFDVAVLRKCDSCDRSQKTSSVGVGHAPNSDRQGALKPGAWLIHSRTAFSVLGLLAGCHAFDEAGSEVMLRPALQALVTKTAVRSEEQTSELQ